MIRATLIWHRFEEPVLIIARSSSGDLFYASRVSISDFLDEDRVAFGCAPAERLRFSGALEQLPLLGAA